MLSLPGGWSLFSWEAHTVYFNIPFQCHNWKIATFTKINFNSKIGNRARRRGFCCDEEERIML
jgi:hypothetical protein